MKRGISMFEIKLIDSLEQKSNICNTMLCDLPSWFGIELASVEYVMEKTIGLVALKAHNAYVAFML